MAFNDAFHKIKLRDSPFPLVFHPHLILTNWQWSCKYRISKHFETGKLKNSCYLFYQEISCWIFYKSQSWTPSSNKNFFTHFQSSDNATFIFLDLQWELDSRKIVLSQSSICSVLIKCCAQPFMLVLFFFVCHILKKIAALNSIKKFMIACLPFFVKIYLHNKNFFFFGYFHTISARAYYWSYIRILVWEKVTIKQAEYLWVVFF